MCILSHWLYLHVQITDAVIPQVVGDMNAAKSAISIISSRLRESQHRDRSQYQGRNNSEDRFVEDDFNPHMNRRSSMDGSPYNSRLQSNSNNNNRSNNYSSRSGGYMYEPEGANRTENFQPSFEDLVFRILCPNDRVDSVVGESSGIMDLLQNEIGVDVKVSEQPDGSEERILVVSSDEVSKSSIKFILLLINAFLGYCFYNFFIISCLTIFCCL